MTDYLGNISTFDQKTSKLKPNNEAFKNYENTFYLHNQEKNSEIYSSIYEKNKKLDEKDKINIDFGNHVPIIVHEGKRTILRLMFET